MPGRQEGELAAVLKRLTWRLGAVEAKVRSRLQQLASTQLEELANLTFRVVNLILAIRDRPTFNQIQVTVVLLKFLNL